MGLVKVRGHICMFFQASLWRPCFWGLKFPAGLFGLPPGLVREYGRPVPGYHRMVSARTVWATGGRGASVQENENVWCPWNIDWVIHIFEAFQANANVVGAFRDVAEFEIAA